MVKEFTTRKVIISNDGLTAQKICKELHWIWDNDDMVYYRSDVDDAYYMEVPKNGSRVPCLKLNSHARVLVKIIK